MYLYLFPSLQDRPDVPALGQQKEGKDWLEGNRKRENSEYQMQSKLSEMKQDLPLFYLCSQTVYELESLKYILELFSFFSDFEKSVIFCH